MGVRKRDFIVGEICWAKVKSYPWWPAKVESVDLAKRTADVTFFGTGQKAKCKMTSALKDYAAHKDEFAAKKLKGNFTDAVAEADAAYETAPRPPSPEPAAKPAKRAAPAAKERAPKKQKRARKEELVVSEDEEGEAKEAETSPEPQHEETPDQAEATGEEKPAAAESTDKQKPEEAEGANKRESDDTEAKSEGKPEEPRAESEPTHEDDKSTGEQKLDNTHAKDADDEDED